MSVDKPLAAALKLLTRRDHSEWELTTRLNRKGFSEAEIAATVRRCHELGYLDDNRFARQQAKNLMRSGRAVGGRLLAELKRYGIDEPLARSAVADAENEIDRDQLLTDLLGKRFASFSYESADDRQRRRVIHYFLRRGFPLSQVLSFVKTPAT